MRSTVLPWRTPRTQRSAHRPDPPRCRSSGGASDPAAGRPNRPAGPPPKATLSVRRRSASNDASTTMALLRHALRLDVTPLQNNLAVCAATVLYFKICLETIYWLRSKYFLMHYSRDLVHVLMSSCVLFGNWYDTSDGSWRLVALVPAVLVARFFYKGAVLKDPEDIEVQALSRSSSPSELLFGPSQCAAVLVWTCWKLHGKDESAVLAASLAVTDGLAPMVGRLYSRRVHRHPSRRAEGTVIAVFLGTVLCCYLYQWWLGFALLPLRIVLAYGGVAAVVGTALKGADNVAVPVALHLLIPRIQEWLPA